MDGLKKTLLQVLVFSVLGVAIGKGYQWIDYSIKDKVEAGDYSNLLDNNEIVVYTLKTCNACQLLKEYLDAKGVKYSNREISDNPVYMREWRELGFGSVPLLISRESIVKGFYPKEIDKLINPPSNG